MEEVDVNVIRRQPRDHRLTTAEILYHMPDYPRLLQRYIWQDYDIAPRFPVTELTPGINRLYALR